MISAASEYNNIVEEYEYKLAILNDDIARISD